MSVSNSELGLCTFCREDLVEPKNYLDRLFHGRHISKLPCGHLFHKICFQAIVDRELDKKLLNEGEVGCTLCRKKSIHKHQGEQLRPWMEVANRVSIASNIGLRIASATTPAILLTNGGALDFIGKTLMFFPGTNFLLDKLSVISTMKEAVKDSTIRMFNLIHGTNASYSDYAKLQKEDLNELMDGVFETFLSRNDFTCVREGSRCENVAYATRFLKQKFSSDAKFLENSNRLILGAKPEEKEKVFHHSMFIMMRAFVVSGVLKATHFNARLEAAFDFFKACSENDWVLDITEKVAFYNRIQQSLFLMLSEPDVLVIIEKLMSPEPILLSEHDKTEIYVVIQAAGLAHEPTSLRSAVIKLRDLTMTGLSMQEAHLFINKFCDYLLKNDMGMVNDLKNRFRFVLSSREHMQKIGVYLLKCFQD